MTEVYDGPQLTPPRVSLVTSADKPDIPVDDRTGLPSERWFAGFDVITEGCEVGRVYAVCPDVDSDPKEFDQQGGVEQYNPFVIYSTDFCSTYTNRREFFDRAERKLLVAESTMLEEQLWTGSLNA